MLSHDIYTYTTNKLNIPIRWCSIQFKPNVRIKRIEAVNKQKGRLETKKVLLGKNKLYKVPHKHHLFSIPNNDPGKVMKYKISYMLISSLNDIPVTTQVLIV